MTADDDYTAQAKAILAAAHLIPHPEDDPPGFEVDLIEELNWGIGVAADSEDEARAKVTELVADELRRRDPNYIPPVAPSTADLVLSALSGLDPNAASAGDVIDVVTAALVDAGATPATVSPTA